MCPGLDLYFLPSRTPRHLFILSVFCLILSFLSFYVSLFSIIFCGRLPFLFFAVFAAAADFAAAEAA